MELSNFTYLALLIFSVSFPLYKSFEGKIQLYRKFKYIFPAIVLTAIPFLAWDVAFETKHIWQFNPEYTLGFNILGLLFEEWLFFFIIPFACIFIYEVMQYFFPAKTTKLIKVTVRIVSLLFLIAAIFTLHLSYTFISFILASVVLLLIVQWKVISFKLSGFFKGYFVSLLPFFLVNGVLTKMPVVLYNNNENLSLRIFSIPVEDMVYLLSLLFINFTIYELMNQYGERKKAKTTSRN